MLNFKNYFTLIVLFFTSAAFAQDSINFKKPIELKELTISNNKKRKLTKIKIGSKKNGIYLPLKDYADKCYPYFLIDDLPKCTVKTIKLFFADGCISPKPEKHLLEHYVINQTDFNLYLYENDNGKKGEKINPDPILVSLKESTNDRIKSVIVDLSGYNITSNSFFLTLEKTTPNPCAECYFYVPILYTSEKTSAFRGCTKSSDKPVPKGIVITNQYEHKSLISELQAVLDKK